jgi:hypothetical protein
MPIVAFYCRKCRANVPLDHFAATACGLAVHPDYAAAVLHSDTDYYGTGLVTVTGGLGCVRSRAIEADKPVVVNPLDYNALVVGSAWDAAMQAHAPADRVKVRVSGLIDGIKVEGQIDRVRWVGNDLFIEDHKHTNNFQYKYLADEAGPRVEYVIQTSIYAELYHQTFGERPTKGAIWYSFSGANGDRNKPPLMPKVYGLMDLARCLDHRPYDGDYSVRELYRQAAGYYQADVPVDAFDLPLAGESMKFGGKGYCDYCQVREACFTAAKGAPF